MSEQPARLGFSRPIGDPEGARRRVRALRDALRDAATRLLDEPRVDLDTFAEGVRSACLALEDGDLAGEAVAVGSQFEAFLERMDGLAEQHSEPVRTAALGLPDDARFLADMAAYIEQRFDLDGDE